MPNQILYLNGNWPKVKFKWAPCNLSHVLTPQALSLGAVLCLNNFINCQNWTFSSLCFLAEVS